MEYRPSVGIYRPETAVLALGDAFYDRVLPARFAELALRFRNDRAAFDLGLQRLADDSWVDHFGRFRPLSANLTEALALRYHGHQFGQYNPALGDGRGFLFAQLRDARGRLVDLGTKGSGPTPWSRGGDGKLTLQGAVREILAAEQLEALGVSTSRALSVIETFESPVRHDEEAPTRGAVLVRASFSHVRFGTFQRLAYLGDAVSMTRLVEYVVRELYPDLASARDPVFSLFDAIVTRTAEMTAAYMAAGFVHGVLNSDNMNVTGESFDYGPWRFLPTLDPTFTAAYFDERGLYAYGRQSEASLRNVNHLADALSHVKLTVDRGTLKREYEARYRRALRERIAWRLGLEPGSTATATALGSAVLDLLATRRIGFAELFHDWFGGASATARALASPRGAVYQTDAASAFRRALESHRARPVNADGLASEPCDLLDDEVRLIGAAITKNDDFSMLYEKVRSMRALGARLCGEATAS